MGNKLYLVVGLAIGYVIGTAAGREQFNKLKGAVNDVLDRPEVKNALGKADAFVAEKAPGLHDVGEAVADATTPPIAGSPS
jgi:hypothetical protein